MLEGGWMSDNVIIVADDCMNILAVTCRVKGHWEAVKYGISQGEIW